MAVETHESKNTSMSHLNKFYQTFSDLKDQKFDGMIITGAPVEQMEFEEVDYWKSWWESWTDEDSCYIYDLSLLGAQAALYHYYGLQKKPLEKKMFGLFWHKVLNRKILLYGDLTICF